ncbi:MAG: GDP-L-fucose synthase family protein [Elusimicrobiota bacterium]
MSDFKPAAAFWSGRKVLVTGGGGFLGSFVVEALAARGCRNIHVPRRREFDLSTEAGVLRLYDAFQADLVLHLAANVGGIGANSASPGTFYYENMVMGALLMEHARRRGVEKFVALGSICSYPKHAPVPFKEEDIWNGYPEETNAPYGLAKKMLLVQAQAYRRQYGYNAVVLFPVNLYGPRDNFDLEKSHVIPALIRKCLEAKENGSEEVVVWGTGNATREFLYVEDAAEGILLAAEHYDGSEPVNLGAGFEIAVKDLAAMIARLTGFRGRLRWDASRPDGQPRRMLDVRRAKEKFGFQARMSLENGLRKTIDWYVGQRANMGAGV